MTDLTGVRLPVGRIRDVLRVPDPLLATTCREVDPMSPDVMQLAADLVATMSASAGCVGLAANQIGVDARVFSLDVSTHPRTRVCHGQFVLVNPVVISATRKQRSREGCMSVPDFTGDVRRASRLQVSGLLPGTEREVTFETDAFEARAIQHEIDHVEGFVFLDRVAGAHAVHERTNYQ